MKKLVALFLALTLCLSLCACGKGGNEGSSAPGGNNAFVKPENYASVLLVTINPQIRLYLDKDSNVLAVEPVNDDAKSISKEVKNIKGHLKFIFDFEYFQCLLIKYMLYLF